MTTEYAGLVLEIYCYPLFVLPPIRIEAGGVAGAGQAAVPIQRNELTGLRGEDLQFYALHFMRSSSCERIKQMRKIHMF